MDGFPIGFWNYALANRPEAMRVRDWVDAGMTLASSPTFDPARDDKAAFIEMLDRCAEAGVRVIVWDERSLWPAFKNGEDAYRAGFAEALADFGSHPAVLGFKVLDEPQAAQFDSACRICRIHKEMAPRLSPFVNLVPWLEGIEGWTGRADWPAYLDEFVDAACPDMLSFDVYSQMNPGTEGWDMYFRNLRDYRAAADRHKIPLWVTLLSVGHFRYRCPREDDLRWQLNTAAAHGANGVMWFFFYMRQPHDNFRVAPIDEHWERTETFEWLSRVNRTFLKGPAETLAKLTLRHVAHVGRAWGGWPLFDGQDGRVSQAKSLHGTDLIVSQFTDAQGADYVAVVNNSQTDSTEAQIRFRARRPRVWHVGWLGQQTPLHENVAERWMLGVDYMVVRHWLAPGQMELFKVADGEN
ncbi:MAG: hypothetical protein GXY33_21880 [Phycisphaerae bacterium]|nr:hypothetical protein [Phycisphaerae bacterium]